MGKNINVKDQLDTERVEVIALMLTAYNSEAEESISQIRSAVNYLKDEDNIGGDVAVEFRETIEKIEPVITKLQTKMIKFGEVARTVADTFDTTASKTKTSFREAGDKLAAVRLKSERLGNK